MEKKRLWHQIRVCLIKGSDKRAEYFRKHHIFHEMGQKVYLQSRKIPLYANLISFHNNIRCAANVEFVTHDVMHTVLGNVVGKSRKYPEKIGCIEVFDNVFIGANTMILYGTKIGPNAIIAAGSIVTKDVPQGTVIGGVPAKKIGLFDKFLEERMEVLYPIEIKPKRQVVSSELEEYMWCKFRKHNSY